MQNQVYQIPQQNSVILVGRLTRDPELKRTTTSKSVCRFDIAMSKAIGKGSADGTKRSRLEVVASRVQFLVRIDAQSAQQTKSVEGAEAEYVSDSTVIDDEEVPF